MTKPHKDARFISEDKEWEFRTGDVVTRGQFYFPTASKHFNKLR